MSDAWLRSLKQTLDRGIALRKELSQSGNLSRIHYLPCSFKFAAIQSTTAVLRLEVAGKRHDFVAVTV